MYSGCVPQTGCKASDLHQFCCPLWWGWAGGGDGGKLAQPELSRRAHPPGASRWPHCSAQKRAASLRVAMGSRESMEVLPDGLRGLHQFSMVWFPKCCPGFGGRGLITLSSSHPTYKIAIFTHLNRTSYENL